MSAIHETIEKNTTGTAHIFKPFRNIVRTGTRILSLTDIQTDSGAKDFIASPDTAARNNALNVLYSSGKFKLMAGDSKVNDHITKKFSDTDSEV